MAVFLLVHGAWHGGWCWADTEKALRNLGHETHAPTMTGLGERVHLAHPEIDADLHVQDICNVVRWRELENVVLVGHSYGGMVVTGVAGQMPERIKARIYLDAFVPEQSGVSLFSRANPERMKRFEEQLALGGFQIEPDMFDAWTDDPLKKAWLIKMCTKHPAACFRRGVTLTGKEHEIAHRLYILASRNKPSAFWAEYERLANNPDWQVNKIATKHDAMVEAPEKLAEMLSDYVVGLR